MSILIDATTEEREAIINITQARKGQALILRGDPGAAVIPIEKEEPDGSWSQIKIDNGSGMQPLQLSADNTMLAIYAAIGRIRINKPATTNPVRIDWGA